MSWDRFKQHYHPYPELGLALDLSRLPLPDDFLASNEAAMQRAFTAMTHLEAGAIANPDEGRMVGHYWLRAPQLAPTIELRTAITDSVEALKTFAADVHSGKISGPNGPFTQLLVVGIGGSALGPQFVTHALGQPGIDKMAVHFFDNTDPDGMDYVLAQIGENLASTVAVVISKSGGTVETRNGMLEATAAFRSAGLDPARHFVAVTGEGSKLDDVAKSEGWLARFPMWDWVGGRTSELCTVGLLPAALQGLDVDDMLAGAAAMDAATRVPVTAENPAALLALAWLFATDGRGTKDMVVLPYKDRLLLFSRYLQQLVMESLGKEFDLAGNVVNQGIAVYGNKGSTDQHAYVQQLREGVNNFFATFIEVRESRGGASIEVEDGITSGDYLQGFLRGTRTALAEQGRASLTISIPQVDAYYLGTLIALFERAVSFYASFVNINAYHQPGVEAGKKAASAFLEALQNIQQHLAANPGTALTAGEIATATGGDPEETFHILTHLAANSGSICPTPGNSPAEDQFTHS